MLVQVLALVAGLLPELPVSGGFRVACFGRHGVAPNFVSSGVWRCAKWASKAAVIRPYVGVGRAQRFRDGLH